MNRFSKVELLDLGNDAYARTQQNALDVIREGIAMKTAEGMRGLKANDPLVLQLYRQPAYVMDVLAFVVWPKTRLEHELTKLFATYDG